MVKEVVWAVVVVVVQVMKNHYTGGGGDCSVIVSVICRSGDGGYGVGSVSGGAVHGDH